MRPLPLSLWCMAVVWRMYGDSDGTGILFLKTWTLAWTASGVQDDHMSYLIYIYTLNFLALGRRLGRKTVSVFFDFTVRLHIVMIQRLSPLT